MPLLLGIDVGTTSVKAGLFTSNMQLLAVAREEYRLDTPSAERVQLDPEIYWQGVVQTVHRVIEQSGCTPYEISALAVSSQGETTITLDQKGQSLYPAIVWLDNRTGSQAAILAKQFSEQVYEITGIQEFVPTWTACKLLWLRENEPSVFNQAWKFILVQDFIIFRMTGRVVTDGSVACTTALYDIRNHLWWSEMLAFIGVSPGQLPEIIQPGSIVGALLHSAAQELGLTIATVVVTGGMDQAVGAIGSGNITPGLVSETTGAALVIQATINDPGLDRQKTIPVYCHSVPGLYFFAPVCPTAGMALKWLRDAFFQLEMQKADQSGEDVYDLMTNMAARVSPGADGLVMLPHLMGKFSPTPDLLARGVFSGFTLIHEKSHFTRAVLEAIAFMLRQNLDVMRQSGVSVHELRVTGGGSRSFLWNQIKADVCKLPILTFKTEDTALLGDAILAGVACGIYKSIEEGCKQMVVEKMRFLPGEQTDAYEEAYQRYCDLNDILSGYFQRVYSK